jgi:copper chaperone
MFLGCGYIDFIHPTRGGVIQRSGAMLKLKIQGMTCGHCVMHVKQALASVPGVEGPVEVTLDPGQAIVGGSPDVNALLAAVAEEGYTASLLS